MHIYFEQTPYFIGWCDIYLYLGQNWVYLSLAVFNVIDSAARAFAIKSQGNFWVMLLLLTATSHWWCQHIQT